MQNCIMKIVINRILNAACVQGLRFGLCFQTARADGNTSEVYRRLIDDQVLGGILAPRSIRVLQTSIL